MSSFASLTLDPLAVKTPATVASCCDEAKGASPDGAATDTEASLWEANGFTAAALGIHESVISLARDRRVRVYCLSDLHVDTGSNLAWVTEHCRPPVVTTAAAAAAAQTHGSDKEEGMTEGGVAAGDGDFHIFICAGDLSGSLDGFEAVFSHLVEHYDAVCFVPGNHDVWCKKASFQGRGVDVVEAGASPAEEDSSVRQMRAVLQVAARLAVHTGPLRISFQPDAASGEEKTPASVSMPRDLVIAPLYAWYHADWDTEPEITDPDYLKVQEMMPFATRWLDFTHCKWPAWLVSDAEFRSLQATGRGGRRLARAFASLNDPFIAALASARQQGATVITFSHFVPREDVSLEKRLLIEPMLTKVIGSCELERQIRCVKPQLHLFGHTHIPIDVVAEGVRYVQWPLGYFREGTQQCEPVRRLNAPMMVYDSKLSGSGGGGGGIPSSLPSSRVTWSARYAQPGSRRPQDTTPSPWLRDRINAFLHPLK